MTEESFKAYMQDTGVRPVPREPKIRVRAPRGPVDIAAARARAADSQPTPIRHGLSTDEPPPMDAMKRLEYVAYQTDRRVLGLLDEVPFPAQVDIDLHGFTVEEAAQSMAILFQQIRERRLTHIRINHGIGRHSESGRPLLKAYVNRWLKGNPDIIAFSSARRSDGGAGVVNVITEGVCNDRWARIAP